MFYTKNCPTSDNMAYTQPYGYITVRDGYITNSNVVWRDWKYIKTSENVEPI
jgi:hypothetical protein